jgi:hypothetical protein
MSSKLSPVFNLLVSCGLFALWPHLGIGQTAGTTINQLCTPKISANDVVASAKQAEPQPISTLNPRTRDISTSIFNRVLQRYLMIISNDTTFAYAESTDALTWTLPQSLGTFGPIAAYPTAVGLGDDPHTLGKSFYVYFTRLPTDGTGWTNGSLRRLTVTCP